METNVNEDIQKLKAEGRSLREIASVLGVSHVAVLKRLRAMEGNRLVTSKDRKRLPEIIEGKDNEPTRSIPHQSKLCHESKDTVNQVVTSKTPSVSLNESVNPLGTPSDKLPECKKGVSQGVFSEVDDLVEAIKDFLESNGIEVYRRQSVPECYQVKHRDQVIRFYVQRKMEEPKPQGEK
jgi:DNA-binding Lrp family transcriptional regulator